MKRLLGKILVLISIPLWLSAASLHMEADRSSVVKGDTVTFTIVAEGKDVEFPVVKSVDGFPILGTAQKSNISIINGSVSRSFSKSYTFAPMHDVTIPSLEVKIDGKVYKTEPLKIEVKEAPPPSAGGSSDISFTISADRKRVHVGEPIELEVTVRYPKSRNYVEVQMQRPEFANFWIKQVGDAREYDSGAYRIKSYRYLIFAQKAGEFKLGPLVAKLARRVRMRSPFENDPFFNDDDFFNSMFARLEWRRIASNSLKVDVEPLPAGVELYGEFDIGASVDKRVVEANRPVHLEITVKGFGNIDDAPKFEPDIPDAVVYADEPKIEARIENGRYGGVSTQSVTIVADRNYTIPPLTLRYVDAKTGKVVEKSTDPIKIEVKGGAAPAKVQSVVSQKPASEAEGPHEAPKTEQTSEERGDTGVWVYLLLGFAAGAGAVFAYLRLRGSVVRREKREAGTARKILRAKSDRELLELLLPYVKKSDLVKSAVEKLEENIFEKGNHKIDKRELAWEIEEIEDRR